jgi:hypothetical protein
MRSKILKASLAIATAAGASVVASEGVSAAGKVNVMFCKKNGQEFIFKGEVVSKEFLKFCSLKHMDSTEVAKQKFYDIKLNKMSN